MGGGQCTECLKTKTGVGGRQLQTKLTISESGDVYEQEADRVAEQVMRMSPAEVSKRQNGSRAQPLVQRRASGNVTGLAEAPPSVHEVLNSPGQPLDPATRAFFEPRFGQDFSHVRLHTDSKAVDSARDVGSHAYTVGHDIVLGADRFFPPTSGGRQLIAHELAHVIQQGEIGASVQRAPDKISDPATMPKDPICTGFDFAVLQMIIDGQIKSQKLSKDRLPLIRSLKMFWCCVTLTEV